MGHREALLEGAKRCLIKKGYTRTTARDIVTESGTNLGSIGYHFGSMDTLMTEALFQVLGDWGDEIEAVFATIAESDPVRRFERCWEEIILSYTKYKGIWAASFDVGTVIEKTPEIHARFAEMQELSRKGMIEMFKGTLRVENSADEAAVGGLYMALLSGMASMHLVDPERAPGAKDLLRALRAISVNFNGRDKR